MEHCEVCFRKLEIIYRDAVMVPDSSGFRCPCGAWMEIFAPVRPFAYRESGSVQWHLIAD